MTKEEFVEQVEAGKDTLYRVCCAYLRQEADRADAVQEALLKAWQALPRLKNPAYFRTWLVRILIRECVNIQRRQHRMVPVDAVAVPRQESDERAGALKAAILSLPEKIRIVVVLFYMEGYAVEEIASILRVPKGTVCSRLSRARDRMKDYLKEEASC